MKLIVSPAAAADLRRLRYFLANKNSKAADQAAAVLASAIQSLDTMPGR
jgi:plasmid stabilization system protein ParE